MAMANDSLQWVYPQISDDPLPLFDAQRARGHALIHAKRQALGKPQGAPQQLNLGTWAARPAKMRHALAQQ
jgi:hypothetical protein